jgi:ketosteroid isomerase-like protein
MSEANVELVRRQFERFAEGGIDAVIDLYHEELVIEIPADMSAEPDTYHGRDGARRYFQGFEGMLEDVRYEASEIIPIGDRVLSCSRMSGRGVTSGLDVALDAFVVHEFEDGLIKRMRPYPDEGSARAAAVAP